MSIFLRSLILVAFSLIAFQAHGETLRQAVPLQQQLESTDPNVLASEALRRGDPHRGAIVFYRSAAACVACHTSGSQSSPLGPNLAELGRDTTETYLVDALLRPSKDIRKGFETHAFVTVDGEVITGMVVRQDDDSVTIRPADNLAKDVVLDRSDIEQSRPTTTSMMPDGLVASLRDQREFFDLLRYVIDVAKGGTEAAKRFQPTEAELAVKDDSINLDHAGIIKKLRSRDFQAGEKIYQGYCFNCHGRDGNTPSLPTARAFGTQPMKFGADPYRMFMTLTKGNGLMAPMSHLTPKERYQVVHYIREQFMQKSNPDYFQVDQDYLASLPKGTEDGSKVENIARDFGPALGSQLRRDFPSVLSIRLGKATIAYDLHTMNQADLWRGGFLDLSETQHVRPRGEGTANPDGDSIVGLQGWRWGHEGSLNYTREDWLPRGPMPASWMDYKGYYLCGNKVVLSYSIDGRDILEMPSSGSSNSVEHFFRIGPGAPLVLAVLDAGDAKRRADASRSEPATFSPIDESSRARFVAVTGVDGTAIGDFRAGVRGNTKGMKWQVQESRYLVLQIPASKNTRTFSVIRRPASSTLSEKNTDAEVNEKGIAPDLMQLTRWETLNWPQEITTVGYPGLQQGAYTLDTITIPDSTPWNTWFRTSALDFFDDGRMVVTTYGGDVWVVSGIDESLLQLRWKRFAAGLYEPFGVRVVDGDVFVTCKDRIVRLHDRDQNGEADFYESFSADEDVSPNFHAFNFDLQTDSRGNFYYAKAGHGSDFALPGAIIQVSPDGKQRSVYCTGFRTPNGMGILPDDRLTASDNQGQWTPASKISLLRPGGFYGWVQSYNIPGMWSPDGGKIDINNVPIPETFDPALVWMPQEFDNSSGGQIWVDDPRFGPLAKHLLHTSFGKGWMSYLMMQDVGELSQAAIIKLPFDFRTGIMRGRVSPTDGQVYATGLQGWNGGARAGLRENGIQRLRYTGNRELMVTDCQVEPDGLRIRFNLPLDAESAAQVSSYQGEQWNYRWRSDYGSDQYKPSTGKKGTDPLAIEKVSLEEDQSSVKLFVSDLKPVHQIRLQLSVESEDELKLNEEIYWTINAVPTGQSID
tara:strand:- start:31302 stop:34574 length:3273 start_codon:yes stop_codon:yes gene_type:complete